MKRNIFRTLICIFIWVTFICTSAYFQVFTVQETSCSTTTNSPCSEPIEAELKHLKGKLFFSPAIGQTENKIKKSDASIEEIKVTKIFPHKLHLELKITPAALLIQCPQLSLSINHRGMVREDITQTLSEDKQLTAQQPICDQLLTDKYLDTPFVEELSQFLSLVKARLPDAQLEWQDTHTLIMKTQSGQRILLATDRLHYQFQQYLYLVDQKTLPEQWAELDLRFQKAIVR